MCATLMHFLTEWKPAFPVERDRGSSFIVERQCKACIGECESTMSLNAILSREISIGGNKKCSSDDCGRPSGIQPLTLCPNRELLPKGLSRRFTVLTGS